MSLVQTFADAFNRRDVAALLACFTEDARYHDGFYGQPQGQAALRAMFERMFREGRDYGWAMDSVVESPGRAAAGRRPDRGLPRALRHRLGLLQLGFAPEAVAKGLRGKYGF